VIIMSAIKSYRIFGLIFFLFGLLTLLMPYIRYWDYGKFYHIQDPDIIWLGGLFLLIGLAEWLLWDARLLLHGILLAGFGTRWLWVAIGYLTLGNLSRLSDKIELSIRLIVLVLGAGLSVWHIGREFKQLCLARHGNLAKNIAVYGLLVAGCAGEFFASIPEIVAVFHIGGHSKFLPPEIGMAGYAPYVLILLVVLCALVANYDDSADTKRMRKWLYVFTLGMAVLVVLFGEINLIAFYSRSLKEGPGGKELQTKQTNLSCHVIATLCTFMAIGCLSFIAVVG